MESSPGGIPSPGSDDEEELRVSTLELFFDLVFVFTLTQLSTLLGHELTIVGAVHVVLIFIVLWWMYDAFAWLTNELPVHTTRQRLLMIVGMAGFLVSALAIPQAFTRTGPLFGVAYLLVVLVHTGLYVTARTAGWWRFAVPNVTSALFITGAGVWSSPWRYALWVAALVVQFINPYLNRGRQTEIRLGHFVERHGLVLILAFGESVVAVGIGAGRLTGVESSLVVAVVLGLALVAALWWTYFVVDEADAHRVLGALPPRGRAMRAVGAYFFAYIPMLLGIITLAAGVERSIGSMWAPLSLGPALALAIGVGSYLAGNVLFRRILGLRPVGRLAAAAVATATVAVGVYVSAAAQLVCLVVVLVVTLTIETLRRPAPTGRVPGRPA